MLVQDPSSFNTNTMENPTHAIGKSSITSTYQFSKITWIFHNKYLHISPFFNRKKTWIFHGFFHQKHRHFPRHHLPRPGQPELDLHRPQTRARDRGPSRPGRLGAGGAGSGDAGGGRSELHLIAIADGFWFCSYVFFVGSGAFMILGGF